jgi:lysophospholipase L1-like esterase
MKISSNEFSVKLFALLGYLIFSLMAIAVLLEIASWAGWSVYRWRHPEPDRNEVAGPTFAGDAWAQEFWREESTRVQVKKDYVPFRIWGVMPWHTKYINNDESETGIWRRTLNPSSSQCAGRHTVNVWMFGGSAVYGAGVPDWATLPSQLSRDLNSMSKDCMVVSNFGVEGYTSNQELISLIEQLKAGRHPDLVIFYDGINDSATADPPQGPLRAHYSFYLIKSRIEGSLRQRLLEVLRQSYAVRTVGLALSGMHQGRTSTVPVSDSKQQAVAVLDNYEENLQVIRALGKAYAFRTHCFWQPSLYYGQKPLVPFEKTKTDALGGDPRDATIRAAYEEAEQRSKRSQNFVFLGHVFDSVLEPLYIDQVHLGPQGNHLVADAIVEYLKEQR